ncbi:unnamed protein product [Rhodiola kirilowii]
MAPSFSTIKLVSESVAQTVCRRGFAKAAKGAFLSNAAGGTTGRVVAKPTEVASSSMWVPDPVTGYYRPENQAVQADAAELRKRLLKNRFTTFN